MAPDLISYSPVEAMSTIPTILVNCVDPNAGVTSIVADEHRAGRHGRGVSSRADTPELARCRASEKRCRAGYGLPASNRPPQRPTGRRLGTDGAQLGHQLGLRRGRVRYSAHQGMPTALICTHERLAVGARLASADVLGSSFQPTCRLSALWTVCCSPRDLVPPADHDRTPGSGHGRRRP